MTGGVVDVHTERLKVAEFNLSAPQRSQEREAQIPVRQDRVGPARTLDGGWSPGESRFDQARMCTTHRRRESTGARGASDGRGARLERRGDRRVSGERR